MRYTCPYFTGGKKYGHMVRVHGNVAAWELEALVNQLGDRTERNV